MVWYGIVSKCHAITQYSIESASFANPKQSEQAKGKTLFLSVLRTEMVLIKGMPHQPASSTCANGRKYLSDDVMSLM